MVAPGSSGRRDVQRSTAEAILDAAESLMGLHGRDGVSLRQIAAAAGSANPFAVQYHFQDKRGLVEAIFARRLISLELRRTEMMAALVKTGGDSDPRRLLEVLFMPAAEERDSDKRRSYAAFLLGIRVFNGLPEHWSGTSESAPVTHSVRHKLRASFPELPESLFTERLLAAATVFLAAVADLARREAEGSITDAGGATCLERALDHGVAVLQSSLSESKGMSPLPEA